MARRRQTVVMAASAGALVMGLIQPQSLQVATSAGFAPVGVSAVTSAVPTGKKAPSLASVTRTGSTNSPFALGFDHRVPRLVGAPKRVRNAFNKAIKQRLAKDIAALGRWRSGCFTGGALEGPASQQVRWAGQIHNRRYASVVLDILSNPGCGGVNQSTPYAFTVDLSTGRLVPLSRFAAPNSGQLRAAVVWHLRRQNPECVNEQLRSTPSGKPFSLPALRSWTVSSSGVTFWFPKYAVAYGACGTVRGRVPWNDIIRPTQVGSTSRTSRMVGEYNYGILTVTGQKAVMFLDGEGGALCARGALRGSRLIMFFMDGSDYRTVWKTTGAGSSRRLSGYRAPTGSERARLPQGNAERLC